MIDKSDHREGKNRKPGRPPFRPKKLRTSLPRPEAAGPVLARKDAERIAKVIARAGLGSRREIEAWIEAGRVSVNGGTISSPALNVTMRDRIAVDGKPLRQKERTRLFLYNKPRGLVTTNADPEGRPTIFEALPKHLPRLISIGRLDINTEGLLLLTNDGGLARVLELPETGWLRRYRVRALGAVTQPDLDKLREGIAVDGIQYGPIEATLDRQQGYNSWITFAIREGKNREVRNVLGALNLQVNRLIRLSFGPFQLGELKEGEVEEVATRALRDQLGERIVAQAGVDFSGPINEQPPATEPAKRATRFDDRRVVERTERKILERRPRREEEPAREPRAEREPRRAPHARDDKRGRDRPREERGRSSERGAADRDSAGQDSKERPQKGKPRRHFSATRVWRQEAKPLRRKFHGEKSERPKEGKPTGEKRDGVIADRAGRKIKVERFATPKPEEFRPRGHRSDRDESERPGGDRQKRPRRGYDRAAGPRPSRPKR
jgi:23S rRNA pseudouridine2605 synthase